MWLVGLFFYKRNEKFFKIRVKSVDKRVHLLYNNQALWLCRYDRRMWRNGRRARLRIWWVTVQVRDLLSAPDILPVKAVPRPLLWTRDFHIVLFVIFESFRDLFDALLHEILTPGVEGREALCG